jgi:glycosyltransferase involved in cell wall biosynthesis
MGSGKRPGFIAAERNSLINTNIRLGLMQRIIYRGCDAVTVNAESVRDEIHRKLDVASERIHYLPNGINLQAWDEEAKAEPPIDLEKGCFHLALIGRLHPQKNHLLVLEALGQIGPERIRDWRVWFFGAATGGQDFADRIRREITQRGLDSIVRVESPTTRIASVLRRLDGVLLPSRYEGFPNVVLEAMALRVPSVVTPVGDIPNMIEDGRTGIVLDRTDARAIAEALARLRALSPEARAAMGEQSRRVVEERFSMPVVAKRYLELYRSVCRVDPDPLAAWERRR